ncbi:hypothetical protein [Rhizobium leguminosarum]|uniref:hypothetical protein n=1 Tax=Rhizobium leguminosarum TaxID=384 RepID=UPI00103C369A|nr:hypothetical protein [Rhizobium leguminosarum]TCA69907.1 hypothetical protein E0H69_26345 [Rhizobium leguminosarum bv. viciae]
MKLHIAAWHYRARAIIQRVWGWSPVEEMVLLRLHTAPGTIESVARSLSLPDQIVEASVARLMQFGLIEMQLSPTPFLTTSAVGKELVHTDRPLPERTVEREVSISLVYERAGHSIFRRKDLKLETNPSGSSVRVVGFPSDDPPETDDTMAGRVQALVAGQLRPGEWMRGVRSINSVIQRTYVVFDLDEVRDGLFPEGTSDELRLFLGEAIKTGQPPQLLSVPRQVAPAGFRTQFNPDSFVVGSDEHLDRFEKIADDARRELFVLSTFVASADDEKCDEKCRENRERIVKALERAVQRRVHVHLFYGTTLDENSKNANAMEALRVRLNGRNLTRGYVQVHRNPVASHAKFLAADDGRDGAVVLLGSCNWLSSPFGAVEVSAEVREDMAVANLLDILRKIVGPLSEARRSVEALNFISADLRRGKQSLAAATQPLRETPAVMTVLLADEHERVLRAAAHDAEHRFVCCTNRVGATMVPGVFNPAHAAGQRIGDVRVYYSRRSGQIKPRHVARQRERLIGMASIFGVREPQLHAKFLAWGDDDVIVTSMNWASQSGLAENPLDEIGLRIQGEGLATTLLKKFEALLPADARGHPRA